MHTNLNAIVFEYFVHRNIPIACDKDALLFLLTEVGELADARMRLDAGWVRNNPDDPFHESYEIGDVLMMLVAYSLSRGVDPIQCMFSKMQSKGFNPYSCLSERS